MKPSDRSRIEPFRAMEGVARANQAVAEGRDIVMMCIGQPGSPAPAPALQAASKALEVGRIGYTSAGGIAPLRQRLAQFYKEKHGLEIDPGRIFVTTGSSAGFTLAFLAAFDPGARIAIPAPGYPAYRNILKTLSLEPVEIPTFEEDRWVITADQIEAVHKTKPLDGILVANPNNPNGTMIKPEAFRTLVNRCVSLGITFISDEIYHGLTYGVPEICALEVNDGAFIINSFSKYFCMTGWRVGWMIVPETMISAVDCLQQNVFICAPEISQIAALAAFEGREEMETVKEGYERNRELVLDRLAKLGLSRVHPIDGAFYAYAETADIGQDSETLARRILDEAGVALTPGTDFDPVRGPKWMRFSFAGEHDDLVRGFDRLDAWLAAQNK